MRRIIFCAVLLLMGLQLRAQQEPQIIYRDTINLRGYVYDSLGKPIKYFYLESSQRNINFSGFHISALTDTNGFFKINGAKLNDTITVEHHSSYEFVPPIYNRGSRYMVIYLTPKIHDINGGRPTEIIAARKYAKKTPAFKVEDINANVEPFANVDVPAGFRSHKWTFEQYLLQTVKYPEKAIRYNVEGIVKIGFTVGKDGRPFDFKVLNGIGYGCEDALIDAIKHGQWAPGFHDGRSVANEETVSVQFKLTDN